MHSLRFAPTRKFNIQGCPGFNDRAIGYGWCHRRWKIQWRASESFLRDFPFLLSSATDALAFSAGVHSICDWTLR